MQFMDPEKEKQLERLVETNSEFRKYYQEHRLLGQQIEKIDTKATLSDDEQLDLVRLKKLKLAAKDAMSRMMFEDDLK